MAHKGILVKKGEKFEVAADLPKEQQELLELLVKSINGKSATEALKSVMKIHETVCGVARGLAPEKSYLINQALGHAANRQDVIEVHLIESEAEMLQ